jgi:hypothetical protein
MKKLIYLLLLMPIMAWGQCFELGVNAGEACNSNPCTPNVSEPQPSISTPTLSIKALYNNDKNWQLGISADYVQLSYNKDCNMCNLPIITNRAAAHDAKTTIVPKTAIPVKAFINKKIFIKTFELYGGVSVGYVLSFNQEYGTNGVADVVQTRNVKAGGMLAGVQIGGSYPISKRMSMNAEISANYMLVNNEYYAYQVYNYPITIGFRYKVGRHISSPTIYRGKHTHNSRKAVRLDRN